MANKKETKNNNRQVITDMIKRLQVDTLPLTTFCKVSGIKQDSIDASAIETDPAGRVSVSIKKLAEYYQLNSRA